MTDALWPRLSVAVTCERRVNVGSDVTLEGISPIVGLPGTGGVHREAHLTIYCELRSNGFVGTLPFLMEYKDAAGNVLVSDRSTLGFEMGKPGARFTRTPTVDVENPGLCWLEFSLNDQFLTRVPILYLFERGPNPDVIETRTSRPDDTWGPYVSIATFAESFNGDPLRGMTLGPTIFAFRVRGEDSETGRPVSVPEIGLNPLAVFRLYPGRKSGARNLTAVWRRPDSSERVVRTESVEFKEPIRPFDWTFRQELDFPVAGTYELILMVDGERLASADISLRHGYDQ